MVTDLSLEPNGTNGWHVVADDCTPLEVTRLQLWTYRKWLGIVENARYIPDEPLPELDA